MDIEIIVSDELSPSNKKIFIDTTNLDYGFNIYVDGDESLIDIVNNHNLFLSCIDEQITYLQTQTDDKSHKELKILENIKSNIDSFVDNIKVININFRNKNRIRDFILGNKELLSKIIVIDNNVYITDIDKIKKYLKEYSDIKDHIYVKLSNDLYYCSIEDCYDVICRIKSIADYIKCLNLSPLETIMMVYDIVRSKPYNEENVDDSPFVSRDLCYILNGDKIVCSGYCNLFKSILYALGIKVNDSILVNELDEGVHVRSFIYIKDSKYDVDGVYYFDPTYDSNNGDNRYLERYTYFAKTKDEMANYTNEGYIELGYEKYSNNFLEEILHFINSNSFENMGIDYIETLDNMYTVVYGSSIFDSYTLGSNMIDEDRIRELVEKFNKSLSCEVLLRVLNKVRKIEYYNNPDIYSYSIQDIYRIYVSSNWDMHDMPYDAIDEVIMRAVDGEEVDIHNYYFKELKKKIERDTIRVKFTRMLRDYKNTL